MTAESGVLGLGVVPILYEGPFDTGMIQAHLEHLARDGSLASEGFMNPEGVVVFHAAANLCFKATIKGDEAPKGIEGA